MNQLIWDKLHEIGLGKNEIEVYTALLQYGEGSVTEIAKKCSVHRVNIYDTVHSLKNKGLVSKFFREKVRMFKANPPEHLLSYLQTKEQGIRDIIPQLRQNYDEHESNAQTFYGLQGIKHILLDMIRDKKSIYAFGIPKKLPELLADFLKTFHRKRIKNKIPIIHIYNENAKERIAYLNKLKYCKAKHLSKKFDVPSTTIVYGNKVAFWILEKEPFSVVIHSKEMATTYKKYFDLLWEQAT